MPLNRNGPLGPLARSEIRLGVVLVSSSNGRSQPRSNKPRPGVTRRPPTHLSLLFQHDTFGRAKLDLPDGLDASTAHDFFILVWVLNVVLVHAEAQGHVARGP